MSPRSIPSNISRTWLLVNGALPESFDAAVVTRTDEIILDIEDAVDPAKKGEARASVIAWLEAGNEAWVRINDRLSPYWADDIRELAGCKNLKGVMLAKVEDAAHVVDTIRSVAAAKVERATTMSRIGLRYEMWSPAQIES